MNGEKVWFGGHFLKKIVLRLFSNLFSPPKVSHLNFDTSTLVLIKTFASIFWWFFEDFVQCSFGKHVGMLGEWRINVWSSPGTFNLHRLFEKVEHRAAFFTREVCLVINHMIESTKRLTKYQMQCLLQLFNNKLTSPRVSTKLYVCQGARHGLQIWVEQLECCDAHYPDWNSSFKKMCYVFFLWVRHVFQQQQLPKNYWLLSFLTWVE